jgi:hypothetical protein
MPAVYVILLISYPNILKADDFITICFNYGCSRQEQVAVSRDFERQMAFLFRKNKSPEEERQAISEAVAVFYRMASGQTPISHDQGGNANDDLETDGRMDCLDHSTNVTQLLYFLEDRYLLKYHDSSLPQVRTLWLIKDHWSAVIVDKLTGNGYVVDPWFFVPGRPAFVADIDIWRGGADPDD